VSEHAEAQELKFSGIGIADGIARGPVVVHWEDDE
jgi:hypothetical protein